MWPFRKPQAAGVTGIVTLSPATVAAMQAEHDRAIAARRAGRVAQDMAHDQAWAKRRAERLKADPILPHRAQLVGRG